MSGIFFDDPNREAVGLEPAWAEGYGGSPGADSTDADPLDDMTKAELIDEADRRGVDVNDTMTKAEIRDAIQTG